MINLSTMTKISQQDVIKKAVEFWGPGGYGLEVKDQQEGYASFEGGGGGVEVVANVKGGKTEVDVASREWDYQAQEFIGKIK